MVLHLRQAAPNNWEGAKCHDQVRRLPAEDDEPVGQIYDPFFHEDDDGHHDPLAEQDAKDFCNGTIDGVVCPLRDGCLAYALTNNERYGVWGGMDEVSRKALRKKWPWRGGKKPRAEWTWMTTEDAIALVSPEDLAEEDSDTDD